jgi:hypothetical protein
MQWELWDLYALSNRNGNARLAEGVTHLDHDWHVTVCAVPDRNLDLHHPCGSCLRIAGGYWDHY